MRTSNVSYLIKKGVSSVWKNFIMSFASFCILLVSLFQVSLTVLVMMNINIIMKNIEDTNEIAIYLKEDISEAQVKKIQNILEENDNLTDVRYISKEQGLENFKENMGEYSDLLSYLDENPVPETFLVRVKDLTKMKLSITAISSIDGIEKLKVPSDFTDALINIRNTFTVIVIAIMATLIVVSIVIVSNTIRTSVFSRRNEISIMKYVGATDSFIKLPFFVEGTFIGILSGTAAWGLTWFVYDSVFSLFTDNPSLWEMFGFFNIIPFDGISVFVLLINCVAGALLGAIGTVISMGRYLKV
ncbi:MAG: permease-like cell division protein FtsX [Oscillospiraceae bacterium]|nr:permease-like cell division protein FtsX [Oscillospiraceae bacterium]